MDFYDSIYQYDLEMENKITNRLNNFLKFINILKSENPLNISNIGDTKYNHITEILEEIENSSKFKNRLLLNKKKNLLLRMNNKTKVNSKYYIYAKNMNQNNHKMDIIEVKNSALKKDHDCLDSNNFKKEKSFELGSVFNQKYIQDDKIYTEENKEKDVVEMLKSDINKILCDMIKQNVKNIYRRQLNDIILKNQNLKSNKKSNIDDKDKDDSDISINKFKEIKNNNYVKIDLSKKEDKERKLHSNHSSEKNSFMKYLINNNNKNKNQTNKDLRNSVTNNNGSNLKIKVCSDMILNFNNLNNGNTLNNLLIVNKKIKSVKNDNGNHNMKIKKRNKEKEEKKDIMDYTHKKNMFSNNNILNNKSRNSEIEDENDIKLGDQSQKKLAPRNMQRIHIKNVKLKNNQAGYNLTNFRKKQISDLDNININCNDKKSSKNKKQKNVNFASPCDFNIMDGKKLNIMKFKLGKNYISPNRKITEKSVKRNKDFENSVDKENSIKSLFDNQTKDNMVNGIKFNSVRKKKLSDKMSNNNDLSQILGTKKVNENNFPIRNYKTNFNLNNMNNNNQNSNKNIVQIIKESDADNIFIINRNNPVKKSLSKEINSQPQIPWHFSNSNANTIMNKSNNKGNICKSYLNQILQIEKKNNANINNNFENNLKNEKKININKQNNIYKDIAIKNKKGINYQFIYEQKQEKSAKNKKLRNNLNNNEKNEVYHDTLDNKGGEPNSYRGVKIKGKRRILSTRVHIRGIKSSKNFKDIL